MLEHLDLLCKINLAECYIALRSGYGFYNAKKNNYEDHRYSAMLMRRENW